MADCTETRAMLWELLDGELRADRAERIMAHVRACAPCKALYDSDLAFLGVLAQVRDDESTPHTLKHRVTHALRIRRLA